MYLQKLTNQLIDGLNRVDPSVKELHSRYLQSAQNPDGGFSGREGGSDLYYTAFALRGLAVLDALPPNVVEPAAEFLTQSLQSSTSMVDFYSFLYACGIVQIAGGPDVLSNSPDGWPDRVAATLEALRTSDGGYAKSPGAVGGSTYHTFLVGLTYELLGRKMPQPERTIEFVQSRQREDGGYVELKPMKRSGTNPTAAAVGTMQLIYGDDFSPKDFEHVVDFLAEMPSMEGGLCANTRIPVADLLSTFTGCWTLFQLQALDRVDTDAALRYARSLENKYGGFRGGIWDENADVEYTFYGLGNLGLLTPEESQ